MQLYNYLIELFLPLANIFGYLSNVLTGGEFTVGLVAFTTHIYIQIASVLSRHMAVAFDIPSHTTGIYFTKLFSLRGMITLTSSLLTYMIKLWVSEDNIVLTLVFWFLVFLSRFIFLICLFISDSLALDIYMVFVLDAVAVGLFQMTFYSFTAEYVSILGICFKASKIWVFLFQIIMDLFIYDYPRLMVKIQYSIAFVLTCISTGLWYNYVITKYNDKKGVGKKNGKENGKGSKTESKKEECETEKKEKNEECKDKKTPEPTFLQHFANSFSPLMMCLVPLMMKNILYPGLMPYSLLKRDKCHLINMIVTPVGLVGSTIVHVVKKTVDSINKRWDKKWHFIWLLTIPCIFVFVLTFIALHSDSAISRAVINSRTVVFWMAVVFFFFHSIVEGAGYLGVVSNVKHCGKVMEGGRKMVSTNQLLGEITSFIFYKFAVGYNVTKKKYHNYTEEEKPTKHMNWIRSLWYWIKESWRQGFFDFVNDFKMNIKGYI